LSNHVVGVYFFEQRNLIEITGALDKLMSEKKQNIDELHYTSTNATYELILLWMLSCNSIISRIV